MDYGFESGFCVAYRQHCSHIVTKVENLSQICLLNGLQNDFDFITPPAGGNCTVIAQFSELSTLKEKFVHFIVTHVNPQKFK